MRRGRLCLAIAAPGALALSLGLGLGTGGAASAAATSAAGPSSPGPVVINCSGHSAVRPGSLTLACADGNNALTGLTWTSWTAELASGYGTQVQNDCQPNCAAGHLHRYSALVVLWGGAPLSGHPGAHRYTKITLVYTGARPQVFGGHRWVAGPATVTQSLAA
jgi:hypothetical protein